MKKITIHFSLFWFLAFLTLKLSAANYYWRAVASDAIYTNIANWETAPGNGISPATAPAASDDVYFNVSSSFTSINLNGGRCRNFNMAAPVLFSYTGSISIYGNFQSNGNATFSLGSTNNISFFGTGTHTIDMGTNLARIVSSASNPTNGIRFEGSGSYSLSGNSLNMTAASITSVNGNFQSNGRTIQVNTWTFSTGSAAKTCNLSGSYVRIVKGSMEFLDTNNSVYNFTGTRFSVSGDCFQITRSTLSLTGIQSIRFEAGSDARILSAGTNNTLQVDSVIFDTPKFEIASIGSNAFTMTTSYWVSRTSILENIIKRPSVTLNIGSIVEPVSLCRPSILFLGLGSTPYNLNSTVSTLATQNVFYRGAIFGGSGFSASQSCDLGLNSGLITWTAPIVGTTYYWIGNGGDWNDATHWSLSSGIPNNPNACVPSLLDDVVFDASSFSSAQSITIGASQVGVCRNITWTDPAKEGDLGVGTLYVNGSADFTGAANPVNTDIRYIGRGIHSITSGTTTYTGNAYFWGIGTYSLADNYTNTMGLYLHSGSFATLGRTVFLDLMETIAKPSIATNNISLNIQNSTISLSDHILGAWYLNNTYMSTFAAAGSHLIFTSAGLTMETNGSVSGIAINYHDVTMQSSLSKAFIRTTNATTTFHDVVLNATTDLVLASSTTFSANTYTFAPNKTYSFSSGRTYDIVTGINTSSSACQELVRIQSATSGSQALLRKLSSPFQVSGVMVQDIRATNTTLEILSGVDLGNNTNVTVIPSVGRNMYWVQGTGNWNDATHWSIGVSGGSPALTNPDGCIPRAIDNVFFDSNSFSAPNQTVTLDDNALSNNVLWTSAAGAMTPSVDCAAAVQWDVFGTLEFAAGVKGTTYLGFINMMGIYTTPNAHSIDMNGFSYQGFLYLKGGGRYDLLDSVSVRGVGSISNAQSIKLLKGSFYTHGYKMNLGGLYLDLSNTTNYADISNSTIIVRRTGGGTNSSYYASHASLTNFLATGSSIYSPNAIYINPSVDSIRYYNIFQASTTGSVGSANNRPVIFNKMDFTGGMLTRIIGNVVTDSLIYETSSNNRIDSRLRVRTYFYGSGTPCVPIAITAYNSGVPATFSSNTCDIDIYFGQIRDLQADLSGGCVPASYHVLGDNLGGNTNWTFSSTVGLQYLRTDTTINCNSFPFAISGDGFGVVRGMTYLWNTTATSKDISANTAGQYSVRVDYGASCFVRDTLNLGVTAPPSITSNSPTICAGQSATLTAAGGDTYTWSTGDNTASTSVSPATTTIYNVTGTNTTTGCSNSTTATVTVNTLPSITSNSPTICAGQSATLTAAGGNTYTWSTGDNTASTSVSPATTTIYNVTGTNTTTGCSNSTTATVTVNTLPSITSNSPTICAGQSATLTAAGGDTYTWSTGDNTASTSVSPAATTIYNVTGTNTTTGCSNSTTATVTVNALPSITSNSPTICAGQSATLTAAGGDTYTWSTGDNTASTSVSPAATTIYNVTGTNTTTGCSNSTSATVTVNTLPSITSNSPTICAGQSATLTAAGGDTYAWSTGDNTASTSVSPAATTIYNLTGTNTTTGCSNSTTATVTVNTLPSITSNSPTICAGQSATLTAAGGNTYTWSTGDNTASTSVSPATTTIYNVTGTNTITGCSNSTTATVTVNTLPSITSNSPTICAGQSATLTAGGGDTYAWSTGDNTASTSVSPAATTIYNVTGTNTTTGCSNSTTATVTVNTLPSITSNSPTICAGQSATLTAGGGDTYAWSTGDNTASTSVSPATTTIYNVTGTNTTTGCSNSTSATVTVNTLPSITSNSPTICAGQSATLTAAGGDTYTWSTGDNTASTSVSPAATTIYNVTGTNTTTGCSNSTTATVTVNTLPSITSNSPTICAGQSATLTAAGGDTYTWSTGDNTASTSVSPAATTIYNVTGTNTTTGCSNSTSATVTVNALPSITSNSPTICAGQSATLTAAGGDTYTWSTGDNTASTSVSPATTTIYNVTGTNTTTGCSNSTTATVTVNALPSVSNTTPTGPYCTNSPAVTLTGTPAGGSFTIDGTPSTSYDPSAWSVGVHTVEYTYTDGNGCSAASSVSVDQDACVFPVVLLDFQAEKESNKAHRLTWYTATEVNLSHYEVERRGINGDFETIAIKNAEGNNQTGIFAYSLVDASPLDGLNRYRLKMVDYDGSFDYSNIVELWTERSSVLSIYPNPATEQVFIQLEVEKAGYKLVCYNSLGQEVYNQVLSADVMQTIEVPVNEWTAGIYLFSLENPKGSTLQQKVMIK